MYQTQYKTVPIQRTRHLGTHPQYLAPSPPATVPRGWAHTPSIQPPLPQPQCTLAWVQSSRHRPPLRTIRSTITWVFF